MMAVSNTFAIVVCMSVLWLSHSSTCHQIRSITISTKTPVNVVDKRFLSIAIGMNLIREHWRGFNISSDRLYTLASGLYPLYFRVGGTAADFLIFDESMGASKENTGVSKDEPITDNSYDVNNNLADDDWLRKKNITNFTMTGEDLDKIHNFASKVGWDVLFDLNVLLRRKDNGAWNSSNPLKIMRYVSEKGYNFAWELGNEPNHLGKFGKPITPVQLGKDFKTLREILDKNPSFGSFIVGPDANRMYQTKAQDYLKQFLSVGGDAVNAVTWHQYYVDGRTASIQDFYNVTILDIVIDQFNDVNNILGTSAPRLKAWMGETGSAWGGGAPGLSDRFVAGFMWLDKLGLAARLNQHVVIRETLFSGHYAIIGMDLLPNPDYWLSLLYKRLVGEEVLEVEKGLEMGRDLRVYAHCTNQQSGVYSSGAVTVMALNVNLSKQATFSLTGDLQGLMVDQYLLTPDNGDLTSRSVRLNGNILQLVDDKTLPDLPPKQTTSDNMVLPPLSFGFFVIPNANAVACTSVKLAK